MNAQAYQIAIPNLLLMVIPLLCVIAIAFKWSLNAKTFIYAAVRMLSQLILIGYALVAIFNQSDPLVSCLILLFMLCVAAWIALRPLKKDRKRYYKEAILAIIFGSIPILILVIFGVLRISPWYAPRFLIPLAGMIFANSMNSVSLCAERLWTERAEGRGFEDARKAAFRIGLLPLLNSFFAVGLVSIPGMMTGQILSGISPLLAARYQIMVMCMLLGASGISAALFITLMRKNYVGHHELKKNN